MKKNRPDDQQTRHRPTSYDVARLAGVSQSAVSRCFRPGNSISEEKRKAIFKAAAKLGYEPNAFASSLITKRSNLVAVLISNLTNLYYPQVLAELTQRLDAEGIRVLLFALQKEGDVGKVLPQIWRYRVDGAIAAAHLSPEHLAQFARHRVPVVLYNRSAENGAVPSVFCDSSRRGAASRRPVGGSRAPALRDPFRARGQLCQHASGSKERERGSPITSCPPPFFPAASIMRAGPRACARHWP
jgi:hypothetical protein